MLIVYHILFIYCNTTAVSLHCISFIFILYFLQQIFSEKLHKAKVTHAELNLRCDWLLATASVDHTVKLWDLRNIKDKSSFLHNMPHDKAVNSGNF